MSFDFTQPSWEADRFLVATSLVWALRKGRARRWRPPRQWRGRVRPSAAGLLTERVGNPVPLEFLLVMLGSQRVLRQAFGEV
jgi:hypothetical protein